MAQACMNVMQHYKIDARQKAVDWGNLLLTGGLIYGGRFVAISQRVKQEAEAKKRAAMNPSAAFGM